MEDGEKMIQEFISGDFKYRLASPVLIISKVRINGIDVSKFLTNQSKVGWYDVSKNSGRDTTTADGRMILNVISTKYRLDLVTRNLTREEIVEFYKEIIKKPTMVVEFLNPFTNTWKTINAYRGDRSAQAEYPVEVYENSNRVLIEMFSPASQALIEL